MPISTNSSQSHFKQRRRSEAVGMSTASLSKFVLDEKKIIGNLEFDKERAKSAGAPLQRLKATAFDILKQRRNTQHKLSELSEEASIGLESRLFSKGRSHSISVTCSPESLKASLVP